MTKNQDPGRPRATKKGKKVFENQGEPTYLEDSLWEHGKAASGSYQCRVPGQKQLYRADDSDGAYCKGR